MSEFAKFSATLGKMTVGDTETKIELVLTMKEVQRNFMFLTNNQKQKVIVSLGDPQVSMNFPEDEREEPYRVYRTDQHGIVEPMDSNQGDLLELVEETPVDQYEGKEVVVHIPGESGSVDYVFQIVDGKATYPIKYEFDKASVGMREQEVIDALGLAPISEEGEPTRYLISDLLLMFNGVLGDKAPATVVESNDSDDEISLEDWEKEIMGETDDDQALIEAIDADIEQKLVNAVPVEPLDIDTYILTEKPKVEGIEYDFPTLLQRKKLGETWMDLAKSLGVPSTQLSSAWSKYKKQVEKMLGDNGAA